MKLKLDENLPETLVQQLAALGHAISTMCELRGWPATLILEFCKRLRAAADF